jgi:hypothetical protein
MTIYRATLIIRADDGTHDVAFMDVIEFESLFWLVPEWLDNSSLGVSTPVRIVSLATVRHSRSRGNPEFVVEDPIPKAVFDGLHQSPEARGFVILERPAIQFPLPPIVN